MIGVGAIGCGYWGPNVIRNLDSLPAVQLRWICDLDAERLRAVGARHPSARMTSRSTDLLEDPATDAIYLATPVSSHFELAWRALEAGKHVLIEKPMATDLAQARELQALAAARQRTLMVGHTFVFSPPVRKVKELIDAGQVGDIHYIETTRVNLGLFQKDASVLWDLGPHDLSILMYWLGEVPVSVSARGRSYHGGEALEDVAFVTLEFSSGVLAQVQLSWLAPSKLRRTSIVGRQRMIVYDDLEPVEKVKIYDRGVERQPASYGEFQLTYRSGDILIPRIDPTEPLQLECAHFVDCIRTGKVPDASPQSGVDVVRVLLAAEKSLHMNGAPQEV
ncbi:MAG: Gfo/Idh/MocA family oxidoreductase [Chloroflexi bacterium]|nr:Gfo/Idh/MocA family oxidoreductase [Chloroflexota bacterium]